MKLCPECHQGLLAAPPRCTVCGVDLAEVAEVDGGELSGMVVADRYRLVDVLGQGAMGWVYRALHVGLDRPVAIKLLKNAAQTGQEAVARFEQEARAASRLHHPHIVTIIDFGRSPGGLFYLVTELVEGSTLDELIHQEGAVEPARAFALFHQIMAAVEEAHWAHVVHRDLKPENIAVAALRSGDDFVKVLDFGIATLSDQQGKRLTAGGGLLGTPGFMAPETIREGRADARSDIYALGAILFELLTGRPLFESDWPMALLGLHLNQEPPPLAEAAPARCFPERLQEVLDRALAKDPARRYQSIAELRADVSAAVDAMGQIALGCQACGRPRDPSTGLCAVHGSSAPAPSSRRGAMRVDATSPTMAVSAAPDRVTLTRRLGSTGPPEEAEAVAELLLGEARVMEVVCPLGGGERRVLALAAAGAEMLGWRVLRAQPDPRYALRPWYPVRRLLGEIIGCGPEPASAATLVGAKALGDLDERGFLGLHLLFGLAHDSAPAGRQERLELVRAAVGAVLQLGAEPGAPTLLVVVDMHEFDRASQRLLLELLRQRWASGLHICASAEGGMWADIGGCIHLRPRPLDDAAIGELLDRRGASGEADPRLLAKRILASTGGGSLAVEQAVAALAEGREVLAAPAELLAWRLQRLPTEARSVLYTLCALGRDVELSTLARLTDAELAPLAVDMLLRAGFVSHDEHRRLAPAHPGLSRMLLDALGGKERQLLHRRLALELGRLGASPFVLAHHSFEGEHGDEAFALLESVADSACAWTDEETAGLVHYRRALHVARWHLLLGDDDPRVLGLSLKLAEALLASGHDRAAEVVLRELEGAAKLPIAARERMGRALARIGLEQRRAAPVEAG